VLWDAAGTLGTRHEVVLTGLASSTTYSVLIAASSAATTRAWAIWSSWGKNQHIGIYIGNGNAISTLVTKSGRLDPPGQGLSGHPLQSVPAHPNHPAHHLAPRRELERSGNPGGSAI